MSSGFRPVWKHWHGASPNTAMTHIAIQEHLDGTVVEWLEKVSDAQYGAPVHAQESSVAPARSAVVSAQPTPAQRLIGDFSPKLVELTDKVLFGDVWARPELSQRDRSLVTVSALIAMNRPDQLRSHLARARDNGVTQDELIEAITHLAFTPGWPNAITAISVAKRSLPEELTPERRGERNHDMRRPRDAFASHTTGMVRGVGQFLDDVKLPGMGYAAFVHGPHAHAKITRILTDDAPPRSRAPLRC